MSINLVTYANQTVTPTNDAIIYERAIDQNGIFYGCNVTVSGNEVHITGGYGIVCGREFTIQSEAIAVTLAPSGTLDGRLYVRLDLADADAPIQLLTATGNTLPPLEQDDDVNYTNGTYEMELATFTVGVTALSDVVETFETITGTKQIPSEIVDYVVEQGTSGGWTYTKWNSGKLEQWYQGNPGSYTIGTQRGSLYSGGFLEYAYPVAFVGNYPTVTVNATLGTDSWVIFAQARDPVLSSVKVRIVSGSSVSSNVNYAIHIYAEGKWK